MRPLRPLRSLLAVATLGGMLLSSVGLAATVSPAAADQSLTDYGIYNVTIDAPPGGFSLGDTGKVNFMTYPTDTAAHPLIIKDGESIVRTLTLPSGLSLNGPFGGVASCPGTARNENTAYDDEGKPMDKTFFVDAVCTEFDNGNGTHSYQVSLTYEVDQFFKLSAALRGSIDVKRTGPLPADAEVSITQSLTPDYGPSAGSQQAGAVKTNPSPDLTASTITASPATVDLNNSTTSTVTVQARDAAGTPLKVGGALVTGSPKNAAGQSFGSLTPFQYTSDGKYTAQLTSTQSGVATVSYAVAGAAGSNTAKVTFTAGNVDLNNKKGMTSYTVTTGDQTVVSGKHTVTVTLADAYGNPVAGQAAKIKSATSNSLGTGKVSAFAETKKPGTYVASVTSSAVGGKAMTATYDGKNITGKNNLTAKFILPRDGGFTQSCTPPRTTAVFADTPTVHKFYKEIDWMECMKYSTGWRQPSGKPLYKPKDNLSREAMAAFIYRMQATKGYVAPKVSPFADVEPGDAFYREIAWMYEKGYSTGWREGSGKPSYRPKQKLTREAMAAFIYRLEAPKGYSAPRVSPLSDMKAGMPFYKEISWMYSKNLTTGNKTATGKEYWPKDELSRQAMAAFIYRLVTTYRK